MKKIDAKPFSFIAKQKIKDIQEILKNERPAVVLQVLYHLPPKIAKKVRPHFFDANFKPASPEILREIERVLERRSIKC